MYNLIFVLHIVITIFLMGIILIQRGRSGGLIEALGGVESIFGTKTSALFVKITVALAIAFFLTTLSLAYLSKETGKSLMEKYKGMPVPQSKALPVSVAPQAKDKQPVESPKEAVPVSSQTLPPVETTAPALLPQSQEQSVTTSAPGSVSEGVSTSGNATK